MHLQIASVVSSAFYVHTVYAEIPKECPAFELLQPMLKRGWKTRMVINEINHLWNQYNTLYEKDNNTVQLIGPCSEGCSFSRLYIPMKGLFNSCDYKGVTKQDNNTIAYRDMSDGVIKF